LKEADGELRDAYPAVNPSIKRKDNGEVNQRVKDDDILLVDPSRIMPLRHSCLTASICLAKGDWDEKGPTDLRVKELGMNRRL
jgi:hypothetical protein